MAATPSSNDAAAPDDACRPCGGTGTVLSGQGGEPHPVTCPWCEGTGRRVAGHDAQAARRAEAEHPD